MLFRSNLASSVSSRTLKLKAPEGYYDGIDDTVTITNSSFIASNIKSGVNLFGITGTMPIKHDDYRGSPGGKILTHGYMNSGYFGQYTGICTGNQLASAVGLASRGSGLFFTTEQIKWVKFASKDRIIFWATKPLRKGISWDQKNSVGVVFGSKEITFEGITYKVRLPEYESYYIHELSLMSRVNEGTWDYISDEDLYFKKFGLQQGDLSMVQADYEGDVTKSYWYNKGSIGGSISKNDPSASFGWRPILEVV